MYSLLVIATKFKAVNIQVNAIGLLFLPLFEVLPELTAWNHMLKSQNIRDDLEMTS
jgi:hypothetical protein